MKINYNMKEKKKVNEKNNCLKKRKTNLDIVALTLIILLESLIWFKQKYRIMQNYLFFFFLFLCMKKPEFVYSAILSLYYKNHFNFCCKKIFRCIFFLIRTVYSSEAMTLKSRKFSFSFKKKKVAFSNQRFFQYRVIWLPLCTTIQIYFVARVFTQ